MNSKKTKEQKREQLLQRIKGFHLLDANTILPGADVNELPETYEYLLQKMMC